MGNNVACEYSNEIIEHEIDIFGYEDIEDFTIVFGDESEYENETE
jgi:hypothetical protein